MDNVQASLKQLRADGWSDSTKPIEAASYYPSAARIVLERDGSALVHTYRIYDDYSDWPGDDVPVGWQACDLVPVTLYRVVERKS